MTSGARPNLGGLFNGSTAPDRSSGIADALGPRLLRSLPGDGGVDDAAPGKSKPTSKSEFKSPPIPTPTPPPTSEREGATRVETGPASASGEPDHRTTVLHWMDPVKAVEQYFALLQTVLDANRDFAVACASALATIPQRVGFRR